MDCQLKFWYSLFPCQTFAQLLILTQLRNMSHSWHDALILLLSVYIFSVRPSTSWQINVFCIIHINVLYLVIIADVNICTSYNSYNLEYTCIICYSAVAWPVLRYIQCSTVPRFSGHGTFTFTFTFHCAPWKWVHCAPYTQVLCRSC